MSLRKLMLGIAILGLGGSLVGAETPKAIPADQFDKLHKLIKPQAGELRFQDIPWLMSVHEARKQAAAEGKPIVIWSGSGGAPLGVC